MDLFRSCLIINRCLSTHHCSGPIVCKTLTMTNFWEERLLIHAAQIVVVDLPVSGCAMPACIRETTACHADGMILRRLFGLVCVTLQTQEPKPPQCAAQACKTLDLDWLRRQTARRPTTTRRLTAVSLAACPNMDQITTVETDGPIRRCVCIPRIKLIDVFDEL